MKGRNVLLIPRGEGHISQFIVEKQLNVSKLCRPEDHKDYCVYILYVAWQDVIQTDTTFIFTVFSSFNGFEPYSY